MANDIAGRRPSDVEMRVPGVAEEKEFGLSELLSLLSAGRVTIAVVSAACIALALLYWMIAPPTFRSDGLVQVEEESKANAMGQLTDLSSLLMGTTVETQAEIQILQSRMVLDHVIDKMNLLIDVRPKMFPIIGQAIVRWNSKASQPVAAPPGLRSYAWGGERIEISGLDVPAELTNAPLKLVVQQDGYSLFDRRGNNLLAGKPGERASAETRYGPVSIFVREILARSGTAFQVTSRARPDVYIDLIRKLKIVEQGKQSGIIKISFSGYSAEFVSKVVENIENAYLRQNVERRSAKAEQSLEFLQQQLPSLKEKVDAAEASLNAYQVKHGTADVSKETEQILEQATDLDSKALQLEQQRGEAMQKFTPQHPIVKALDEQIALVKAKEESIKGIVSKLPTTQQDIFGLRRDLEVAEKLYTDLLDTIQQLEVAKAGTIGNVRIVDHALQPFRPTNLPLSVILLLGLLAGVFLGATYVLFGRATLRGVDDPLQVEARFGLTTYASIPYSKAQHRLARRMARISQPGSSYILTEQSSGDLVVEALRSLRTSLHFALIESPNNVLMLTGPTPGIGKSFVSVNLGALLSISGKKTVVVDLDLRKGHIHRYFGDADTPGITELLTGAADYDSIVRSTHVDGLKYIGRGAIPPNPAELLLSDKLSVLMKRLSSDFDLVLLDTPPVLAVTDAAIVGRLAGCTMLVLKSAYHSFREIDEVLKRLSAAHVKVRGVIFNQVGATVGSYGYGYGGYYYSYESTGGPGGGKRS